MDKKFFELDNLIGVTLFLMLILGSGLAATEAGCWDGVDGAIHHYTLNSTGDLTDQCGSDDLNNVGVTDGTGVFDGAGDFENSENDHMDFADPSGETFSYAVWYKPESSSSVISVITGGQTAGTKYANNIYLIGADNTIGAVCHASNTAVGTTGTISDGSWGHIVYTVDGATKNNTIYLNTTKEDSSIEPNACTNDTTGTTIGLRGSDTTMDADGLIDELWVFSYVISSQEIETLYLYNNITSGSISWDVDKREVNEQSNFSLLINDGSAWYNFDFGDGNSTNTTETWAVNTYVATGIYLVNVTSAAGRTSYRNISIFAPVTANFGYTPASPHVSETITFNDTTVYPANQTFSSGFWDFGDGTNASTQNTTHTYSTPGDYNVTFTLTTNETTDSSITKELTVSGIKITVYDETTSSQLTGWNVTISNSTLSNTTTNNTIYTQNTTTGFPTGELTIIISRTGYVTRTYYGTFDDNNYILLVAYLLPSGDGVFMGINTKDAVTQDNIDGVLISAQRNFIGSYVTVQQGLTDSAGIYPSFYLSPFITYKFTASKTGCTTFETFLTPSETTYTFLMDCGGTDTNYESYYDSFYYRVTPLSSTIQSNETIINFTYYDPDSSVNWINCSLYNSTLDLVDYANVTGSSAGVLQLYYLNLSYDFGDDCDLTQPAYLSCSFYKGGVISTVNRTFYPGCTDAGLIGVTSDFLSAGYDLTNLAIFFIIIGALVGMGVTYKFGFGGGFVTMVICAYPFVYLGFDPILYTVAVVLSVLTSMSKRVVQ